MTNSINVSLDISKSHIAVECGKRSMYLSFRKDPVMFSEYLEGKAPRFRNVVKRDGSRDVIYSILGRPLAFGTMN